MTEARHLFSCAPSNEFVFLRLGGFVRGEPAPDSLRELGRIKLRIEQRGNGSGTNCRPSRVGARERSSQF